jgi:hypothetical protein
MGAVDTIAGGQAMKPMVWRAALSVALVATLLAAYFAPEQAGEGVALTEHAAKLAPAAPAQPSVASAASPGSQGVGATSLAVLTLEPRGPVSTQDDLFDAAQSARATASAPAVVPPQQPAAAPSAVAPSPPLKMIGRYVEDGKVAAFVQFNDQNLVLHQGDVVADVYKVEHISDNALTVRYLPLDQVQTVGLNAPN